MERFFQGAACAVEGIRCFYRDVSLWKYIVGPWCLIAAFYTGTGWLIFYLSHKLEALLNARLEHWPEFLRSFLSGSLTFCAVLLAIIIVLTTLNTCFEIFGGLFFDKLIEAFEKKYYQTEFPEVSFGDQIRFTFQASKFALNSLMLLLFLLVFSFFLPVAGQLLLVFLMGRRMASSFLFAPGFLRGRSVPETKQFLRGRGVEVTGFGVAVYLIQLIPLLLPLTLPGMILGSVILYNGRKPRQEEFPVSAHLREKR